MTTKEEVKIIPDSRQSGELSDIQVGKYQGNTVGVKTLRIDGHDELDWLRKVRRDALLLLNCRSIVHL